MVLLAYDLQTHIHQNIRPLELSEGLRDANSLPSVDRIGYLCSDVHREFCVCR